MKKLATIAIGLALAGCAASDAGDRLEGEQLQFRPMSMRENPVLVRTLLEVGGTRRYGLVGAGSARALDPEYEQVLLHSAAIVFTRRPGQPTFDAWRVAWAGYEAELTGPEPTPWVRFQPVGKNDPDAGHAITAKPFDPRVRRLAFSAPAGGYALMVLLDERGLPLGDALRVRAAEGNAFLRGETIVANGEDVTFLLDLEGQLRLPPLPNLRWVVTAERARRFRPALAVDPAFAGREGLVWPLDEATMRPWTDATRSVVGYEPLYHEGLGKWLIGWIAHHRTPEGPRVGFCSIDGALAQGPFAARFDPTKLEGADGSSFLVPAELPGGGWVAVEVSTEWGDGQGVVRSAYRVWGEDTPSVSPLSNLRAAFAGVRSRRLREEHARFQERVRAFEAALGDVRSHEWMQAEGWDLGPRYSLKYLRRYHPRNERYIARVLEHVERTRASVDATDLADVKGWHAELRAQEELRAKTMAALAERDRREQERAARIQAEHERQDRERADAKQRADEREAALDAAFADAAQGPWASGPSDAERDAARRAVSESLFRYTYGQQDWRWEER